LALVRVVALGANHACVLRSTAGGDLYCFGANNFGQLGNGSIYSADEAVHVSTLPVAVVSVSTGDSHSCAVTTAQELKCWGSDSQGQLGDDLGSLNKNLPVSVAGVLGRRRQRTAR
jgi:alpha-tubulin suppressor-like RCC1 family protein